MHVRVRKRSAAITLVLAGSAGLGGCGSPVEQRDAYSNLQDCVKDWSDTSLCEPVKDGRYSTSYLYGPPYYSSSGWSFFGRDRIESSPKAKSPPVLRHTVWRDGCRSIERSFSSDERGFIWMMSKDWGTFLNSRSFSRKVNSPKRAFVKLAASWTGSAFNRRSWSKARISISLLEGEFVEIRPERHG
jgi:hypothetical protein